VIKFWHDIRGSVFVEYTIVFPLFILVTLGSVDVSYMLYEWALASKAAYVGARWAVVSNPVAQNITTNADLYSTPVANIGQLCFDPTNGQPTSPANCPSIGPVVCTSTACTPSTYGFDSTAFTNTNTCHDAAGNTLTGCGIFDRMQAIFPRLQPQDVQVSYQTNGLGYVLRPNGLPMNVTVSIKCMTHEFFFIGALMGWVFPPPPTGCPVAPAGPVIPAVATTLTTEDIFSN
jgi:Flp pilus assembly protein TadG